MVLWLPHLYVLNLLCAITSEAFHELQNPAALLSLATLLSHYKGKIDTLLLVVCTVIHGVYQGLANCLLRNLPPCLQCCKVLTVPFLRAIFLLFHSPFA